MPGDMAGDTAPIAGSSNGPNDPTLLARLSDDGRVEGRKAEIEMKRTSSTLIGIGGTAALIAAGVWFFFSRQGSFYGGSGHWYMPYGMMSAGGIGMGGAMIFIWIIFILALVLMGSTLFTNRSGTQCGCTQAPDALNILKRRYANGEIDKVQFDAMRKDLDV